MGSFHINLPDVLERDFEIVIVNKFGMKRGNKKKAIIEAIKNWIEINKEYLKK